MAAILNRAAILKIPSRAEVGRPIRPNPVGPKPNGPNPIRPNSNGPNPIRPNPVRPKPNGPNPIRPKLNKYIDGFFSIRYEVLSWNLIFDIPRKYILADL